MSKQPNVLVIISDEHAPMFSGPYGHPLVKTPNMDRLAEEGVTFRNAYCNSPLCVPSRMSFMTGRFASRVGVYDNASPLSSGTPTWAHYIRSAGYDVALAGKQHFVGPDQLHGFGAQLSRDLHAEKTHAAADWSAGVVPKGRPWPDPYEAGPGGGEHIDYDDETAEAAEAWLRDPARQDQPWVLCAGFLAPHFPLVVPQKYWDMYPPKDVDLPVTGRPTGEEGEHPVHQRMRAMFGMEEDYPEDVVSRGRAAYYGLITYLDDQIGQLLTALDDTGQADNTVVIHTSDHGEMNGEHGMWRKSNFYEEAVRVPLQLRWPGSLPAGRMVEATVSLVDVVASMVTMTGAEAVAPLDGDDLLPLARGEDAAWKDEAYSEYLAHGVVRPTAMLRSRNYKLNASLGDPDELYDLDADPQEQSDLAGDAAYDDVRQRLRKRLASIIDLAVIEQEVLDSQAERMEVLRSAGWTPSVTPELTRETAHVDRSKRWPGVPSRANRKRKR